MRRVNKSWTALVAAALLLGTLVGVVWATPHDSPQAADTTRKVTLAAADFIPAGDGMDWSNSGYTLLCQGTFCGFTAPVVFPCLPSVTVERIKLHVEDSNASGYTYAELDRVKPRTGAHTVLGSVQSPEGTSEGLKTYTSPDINKVVWPSQKAYIVLQLFGTNMWVRGVTVEYHRNT